MNWLKIIKLQKELDKELIKAHSFNEEDVFFKKKLALLVEISELANEIKVFKYWSLNKEMNYEKAIFEYADCMHFMLSFCIFFQLDLPNIGELEINEPIEISNFILLVMKKSLEIDDKKSCEDALLYFLYLGKLLKFSDDDIEKYYLLKNAINFERIKGKY